MKIVTRKDSHWWDLLRLNCRYRNGNGQCINRPRKMDNWLHQV